MARPQRSRIPLRGDVWLVSLDPVIGHEQGGQRPGLIVSNDRINRSPADLVSVAPISGTDRRIPLHLKVGPPEGGLTKPSVVMLDQIRTVSKARLGRYLGSLSPSVMAQVDGLIARALLPHRE